MIPHLFHSLRRRAIARAVLGELPPDEDARLRAELRACAGCRRHYDRLARVRSAASARDATAATGERVRLLAALAAGRAPARSRRLVLVLAPTLAAAAVAVVFLRQQPTPDEITWRGGAEEEEAAGPSLTLYAIRKPAGGGAPGPVRVLGHLPGSGEARISLGDYLQLGYSGLREPAYLAVVGVADSGAISQFFPRPGASIERLPSAHQIRSLRPSVDLSVAHRPGRMRLFAVFSSEPGLEAVRAAAERWHRTGRAGPRLELSGRQISGMLLIEP